MRVVIVGQGYVGLPLAMRAVDVGHTVVGYDVDGTRVKRLCAGESYVEDVPDELLHRAIDCGRYRASSEARSVAGFDVAVITVPTPLRDGAPDLSYIVSAASTLARFIRPGATVVLESTTYPGTTRELLVPILEEGSALTAGEDFYVAFSPERIDPGNTSWTITTTPKIVSGVNSASLAAVTAFYDSMIDSTVPVSSPEVAELAKLLENTYRHVNIALVNELALFAHELGIDVWEAIDAAATKPFGFMKFTPGPGVGGHCLPIDPSYLSWRVKRTLGRSFRFVELANDVNDHMPEFVVRRLVLALNERGRAVNGSHVLLLGMAYKRNTGDARESPALRVAQLLLAMGADVHAVDPFVSEGHVDTRVARAELTPAQVAAADAVVVLADHDEFDYAPLRNCAAVVLDTRHCLDLPGVEYL